MFFFKHVYKIKWTFLKMNIARYDNFYMLHYIRLSKIHKTHRLGILSDCEYVAFLSLFPNRVKQRRRKKKKLQQRWRQNPRLFVIPRQLSCDFSLRLEAYREHCCIDFIKYLDTYSTVWKEPRPWQNTWSIMCFMCK